MILVLRLLDIRYRICADSVRSHKTALDEKFASRELLANRILQTNNQFTSNEGLL